MEIIQFGSLAILFKWVLLGASFLFALLIIKIWLKRNQNKEVDKQVFDQFVNSLFLLLFAWKVSLVFLEPGLIVKSPFSLLYFTGGPNGLIIAIVISIFYFIYLAFKSNLSFLLIIQSLFIFAFTSLFFYHFLSLYFFEVNDLYHLLIGAMAIIILYWSRGKGRINSLRSLFQLVVIFSFFNLIVSFVVSSTTEKVLLFSVEQWFYIILILISLIKWEKKVQS